MTLKFLFILSLALIATAVAQTDDELHIPEENDNQFPPVIHTELDATPIEGSGSEEPLEIVTTLNPQTQPPLEDEQLLSSTINNESEATTDKLICPAKCICTVEGETYKYVVDCSDAELTELPTPLDGKTTELNLENNKLTVIPKDISQLKNLRKLNVNNNQIMEVAPGSISELPELVSLTLEKNRLMEYPTDFKNSFGLTKLQEFDLGGNDMRTVLKAESFSIFKALQTLTLPSATPELVEDLCSALKESLEAVCIESCNNKRHDCPDAPESVDDLDIVIPALIPSEDIEDNEELIQSSSPNVVKETENEETVQTSPTLTNIETTTLVESAGASIDPGVSFHSAVIQPLDESALTVSGPNQENVEQKQNEVDPNPTADVPPSVEPNLPASKPAESEIKSTETEIKPTELEIKPTESEINPVEVASKATVLSRKPEEEAAKPAIEEPILTKVDSKATEVEPKITKEEETASKAVPNSNLTVKTESEVVGATTSNAKTGGVDKSIIAIVVAGMVLVVAGITIKKNWTSIRKRFSSAPRNDTERGINGNGTAPEEVPLQEKSPV